MITYTTINQETLEATNTGVNQTLEIGIISGNDTAIEANIHPALTRGSLDLLVQVGHSGSGRDGIQRHVNHGGDTTKGSSLGAGVEALPLGTARLVQVNVSIDQTGQQYIGRVVGVRCTRGEFRGRNHGIEDGIDLASSVGDDNGSRGQTARDHGTRRRHDGDGGHVSRHSSNNLATLASV